MSLNFSESWLLNIVIRVLVNHWTWRSWVQILPPYISLSNYCHHKFMIHLRLQLSVPPTWYEATHERECYNMNQNPSSFKLVGKLALQHSFRTFVNFGFQVQVLPLVCLQLYHCLFLSHAGYGATSWGQILTALTLGKSVTQLRWTTIHLDDGLVNTL